MGVTMYAHTLKVKTNVQIRMNNTCTRIHSVSSSRVTLYDIMCYDQVKMYLATSVRSWKTSCLWSV